MGSCTRLLLIGLATAWSTSCALVNPGVPCTRDEHCEPIGACVDGICDQPDASLVDDGGTDACSSAADAGTISDAGSSPCVALSSGAAVP